MATVLDFQPVELRKSGAYSFNLLQGPPGGLVIVDAVVPASVAMAMLEALRRLESPK
jgi:hypothetical protein